MGPRPGADTPCGRARSEASTLHCHQPSSYRRSYLTSYSHTHTRTHLSTPRTLLTQGTSTWWSGQQNRRVRAAPCTTAVGVLFNHQCVCSAHTSAIPYILTRWSCSHTHPPLHSRSAVKAVKGKAHKQAPNTSSQQQVRSDIKVHRTASRTERQPTPVYTCQAGVLRGRHAAGRKQQGCCSRTACPGATPLEPNRRRGKT